MQNYWIGIMALAFVLALAAWLLLVFNANRHGQGRPQESSPQREVIGGEFEAREGGRQLMPHPAQPSEPSAGPPVGVAVAFAPGQTAADQAEPARAVPSQRTPVSTRQDAPSVSQEGAPKVPGQEAPKVPEQGAAAAPEHADHAEHSPAPGDRP